MPSDQVVFWVGFNVFVLAMLALDLGVFNRKAHVVKFREALTWSAVWISLAGLFAAGIYFFPEWLHVGAQQKNHVTMAFVTGYLVELSLSVDNLFVFLVIFRYFRVPATYQHKVLFWGIVGALVMRAIFIFAGVALIERFHWLIYVFGAFLVYTGYKLATEEETEIDPEKNPVLKFVRKFVPVTNEYHGSAFFIRQPGLWATPLFLVLVVVETTDVLFAADSIPAILAITQDPALSEVRTFIVYTSNVFAILGLRSMYFALAGLMGIFHYLNYGLAAILMFIGFKMLISSVWHVPIPIALGVVAGVLALSVVASVIWPPKDKKTKELEAPETV